MDRVKASRFESRGSSLRGGGLAPEPGGSPAHSGKLTPEAAPNAKVAGDVTFV
jgi:hypothetical protein